MKNQLLILSVATLSILVVVVFFVVDSDIVSRKFSLESAKKSPLKINTQFPNQTIENNDFSKVIETALPEKASVYRFDLETTSPAKAQKIAAALGFSGGFQETNDAVFGKVYSWQDKEKSLSVSSQGIEFVKALTNLPKLSKGNPQDYFAKAKKILEDLSLGYDQFIPRKDGISFLVVKGNLLEPAPSSDKSQIVRLTFDFVKDNLPFLLGDPQMAYVEVSLSATGEMVRLSYKFPPTLKDQRVSDLINVNEAKKKVQAGEGILVNIIGVGDTGMERQAIESASYDKISLGYYQPLSASGEIQPVYVFRGKGKVGNSEGTIYLYLPAVWGVTTGN